MIEQYLRSNQNAFKHQFKADIEAMYKISREGESSRYRTEVGNHMLLWHGSRLTNFVGILSQGLRIAPPEAPISGYMFGKGLYFADIFGKSAEFCYAPASDNTGLLLLCRVAVGTPRKAYKADFNASSLPPGMNSTLGVGLTAPPENSCIAFRDMLVPIGQGEATKDKKGSLLYNEYVVYDVAQVQIEYLIKCRFDYNPS